MSGPIYVHGAAGTDGKFCCMCRAFFKPSHFESDFHSRQSHWRGYHNSRSLMPPEWRGPNTAVNNIVVALFGDALNRDLDEL